MTFAAVSWRPLPRDDRFEVWRYVPERRHHGKHNRTRSVSLPHTHLESHEAMHHALMYHGAFEQNFSRLRSGASEFTGSDGKQHQLGEWPAEAKGLRVGYMERAGKKFVAVRVMDDEGDLVLQTPATIDQAQHMGFGKRFSAEPTLIEDETAFVLLRDIIARNPAQAKELEAMRDRVAKKGGRRRTAKE